MHGDWEESLRNDATHAGLATTKEMGATMREWGGMMISPQDFAPQKYFSENSQYRLVKSSE